MTELFETVLILSLLGFGITAILLCLKPITTKKFPAKWQYYVWIAVLITMIIPAYKLIPEREVKKIQYITQDKAPAIDTKINEQFSDIPETLPIAENKINVAKESEIKVFDLLAVIWICGMASFLLIVIASYIIYILKKRKNFIFFIQFVIAYNFKKCYNGFKERGDKYGKNRIRFADVLYPRHHKRFYA